MKNVIISVIIICVVNCDLILMFCSVFFRRRFASRRSARFAL